MCHTSQLAESPYKPFILVELRQVEFAFISIGQHHPAIAWHLIYNINPIFCFHILISPIFFFNIFHQNLTISETHEL